MIRGGEPKPASIYPNRLWLARKRARLRQKQVALLLDHHTVDQVSRYEKGERVPSLDTALRFQIILRTPVHILFSDRYVQLASEVGKRAGIIQLPPASETLITDDAADRLGEFCTYADRLRMPAASHAELTSVRRHVVELAKGIASR